MFCQDDRIFGISRRRKSGSKDLVHKVKGCTEKLPSQSVKLTFYPDCSMSHQKNFLSIITFLNLTLPHDCRDVESKVKNFFHSSRSDNDLSRLRFCCYSAVDCLNHSAAHSEITAESSGMRSPWLDQNVSSHCVMNTLNCPFLHLGASDTRYDDHRSITNTI